MEFDFTSFDWGNLIACLAFALSVYNTVARLWENRLSFTISDPEIFCLRRHGDIARCIIVSLVCSNQSNVALSIESIRILVDTNSELRPLSPIEIPTLLRSLPMHQQIDRNAVQSALGAGVPILVPAHGAQRISFLVPTKTKQQVTWLANIRHHSASMPCTSPASALERHEAYERYLCLDISVRGRSVHRLIEAGNIRFSDGIDIAASREPLPVEMGIQ